MPAVTSGFHILEEWLEFNKVCARRAICDLLGFTLFPRYCVHDRSVAISAKSESPPSAANRHIGIHLECVTWQFAHAACKKLLAIKRHEQFTTLRLRAQAMEQAHRVKALEDVAIFGMLRFAPVQVDEALNVLEAGDDALLPRRASAVLFGGSGLRQVPPQGRRGQGQS